MILDRGLVTPRACSQDPAPPRHLPWSGSLVILTREARSCTVYTPQNKPGADWASTPVKLWSDFQVSPNGGIRCLAGIPHFVARQRTILQLCLGGGVGQRICEFVKVKFGIRQKPGIPVSPSSDWESPDTWTFHDSGCSDLHSLQVHSFESPRAGVFDHHLHTRRPVPFQPVLNHLHEVWREATL